MFVYGHPDSADDPSAALTDAGVAPHIQEAVLVLLHEHLAAKAAARCGTPLGRSADRSARPNQRWVLWAGAMPSTRARR